MSSSLLFSGSSHPILAQEVSHLSGIPLGKIDIHTFPDKEIFVEVLEPVRHRHVYVFQSIVYHPNDYLMELFLILDALKRADVASITTVLPYYGYARQDRIDKPGVSIAAKLVANLLVQAGTQHVITMDLHSEQIEGFFDIPVEQLLSRYILIPYCSTLQLQNLVVVAPDKGGIKIASAYAKQLGTPLALIDKERIDTHSVDIRLFVGDVKGKTVLIPDDMCATGGTLVRAAEECARLGAKQIIASVGHGLFTDRAIEKIEQSPIEQIITTNSIPLPEIILQHPKVKVLSIGPLFAKALK